MSEAIDNGRKECHQLLVNLKTTVEGLLATPSSNVWNTYGGLPRLFKDVEAIMDHRLQVTQGPHGSSLDYWNFVRGLRWLNPTLAPSIEQYHKMTRGSRVMRAGQAWLQQSLREHRLSAQLLILVSNTQHLHQHYIKDEAFLCSPPFFQAMITCLQAVEHNKAALLAEIDTGLLLGRMPWQKLSVGKSISLPCVSAHSEAIMIRRTATEDRLAPPLVSPKSRDPVPQLTMSGEHAAPLAGSSSPDESAKEALLQVLGKSGTDYDREHESFYNSQGVEQLRPSDPLMHMEISVSSFAKKSSSASNLQNIAEDAHAKSKSSSKHYKPSPRDETKPKRVRRSETLDMIFGEDNSEMFPSKKDVGKADHIVVNGKGSVPRRSSIEHRKHEVTTQSSSGKKASHSRSKSDVGVATPRTVEEHAHARITPDARDYAVPGMTGRDGYFPRPAEGQSLMNYLSSQDFHTCAELDKENAHFSISEALIAAIEQMKWNQVIRPQKESDHEDGDSDEEIQQLKQRIRIRRRERLKEKAKGFPTYTSDGRTDTGTNTTDSTSLSESIISTDTSEGSSSDSEEIHDTEIEHGDDASESTSSNLTSLKESGLSLSMASLYSDADLQKSNHSMEKSIERSIVSSETPPRASSIDHVGFTNSMHSAESVAISLLKKFSENQLPKASELAWMVSEQDAPQALLPLPDSYPISPDDNENSDIAGATMRTRIRGNLEWAPPRAQIVFNIHPTPKRKVVLTKQNFRCAGCGTKVETGYMKRYRYCEYLGKYFCPCCHTNELSHIPGRIIKKWDFSKYCVSNFARDLLARIQNDPLFSITAVNQGLYRKVRTLDQIRECRIQLQQMRMFLHTCRLGQSLLQHYDACPGHWFTDIDTYTLNELLRVKKNEILPYLTGLVNKTITHINNCPLCQAKGFICELCNNAGDILFPYELSRVKQCNDCAACYHSTCYVQGKCPRCARIESRRLAREREQPKSYSDESEDS